MSTQTQDTPSALNLRLSQDDSAELRALAAQEGTTVAAMAARVLGNGLFLIRTAKEGNRVIIEDRRGARRTLTPS